MLVPARNGDGHAGNPGPDAVNRAGVCPTSAGLAELEGDMEVFPGLGEMPDQARIGDQAGVGGVNGPPGSEARVVASILLVVPDGQIVGWGRIDGERQVGIEGISRYPRAARLLDEERYLLSRLPAPSSCPLGVVFLGGVA